MDLAGRVNTPRTCVAGAVKNVSVRLLSNDGDGWQISSLELKGIASVKPRTINSVWIEIERTTIYLGKDTARLLVHCWFRQKDLSCWVSLVWNWPS